MHNKTLLNIGLWLGIFIITAVIGLHVRFYPLRADIWSQNTEKATALVIAKIRLSIAQQMIGEFPDMPEAQRNRVIEEKFAQTLHKESAMVKKAISEVSKNINAQIPDADKHIYLQEADGYYYYDLTQNLNETGRLSGEHKGSKFLNERMNAPFGFWQPINLHPYIGLYIYKFLKLFQSDISIMNALCYSGPLLSLIALGVFIFCCRSLAVGPLATLIAGFYFYLAPIFVKRSTFAWNDDDSYNLIFPLLIFALVFKGLSHIKTIKDCWIYGLSTAAVMCLYSLFWHGWGFTFAIIGLSSFVILGTQLYFNKTIQHKGSSLKNLPAALNTPTLVSFLAVTLITTPLLMSIIFGPSDFLILLKEGFSGLQKLTTNQISLWPNLFIAVGELNRSSLKEILEMTGNLFWWGCAIGGLLGAFYLNFLRKDRIKIFQLIILLIALLATLKITLGAQRFILLCLIPTSLLAAIGLDYIIQRFRQSVHTQTLVPTTVKPVELFAGMLFFIGAVFFPIKSIHTQIPELLNPIFNSTWQKALIDIKNNTPPESIITSWWPPGHFIKAIARRRVTFDGATITSNKEAYWVANILLTSNEQEAAGILRMLNSSGTKAIDLLINQNMKTSDAISLLHFILTKKRAEAFDFLKRIMPEAVAKQLIELTHGPFVPSYLLIYSELMEKNIGLQFVGKWNFNQMQELNENPEKIKLLPQANSPQFFEFLWQTIGGAYRYSEALINIGQNGSVLDFTEGLKVDLNSMSVSIASSKFGTGIPLSVIYLENDSVIEKIQRNANLKYSVVFFQENSKYYCRLMDQELAQSLLTKMYFFKGKGLKYFKPFSMQSSLTGRDEIFVFELVPDDFIR